MFLRRYLDDFYFDMVMNNYDISYLESIDEDNFEKIYCLLKMYNFYYINDIILNYIEIRMVLLNLGINLVVIMYILLVMI